MPKADYSGRNLDDILNKIRKREDILIHDVQSATGLVTYGKSSPKKCYWIEAFNYLVVPRMPAYSPDKLNSLLFSVQEEAIPDYSIYFRQDNFGLTVGKLFFFSEPMEASFGEALYNWTVINLLPSKGIADSFLVSSPFSEIQRSIQIPKRDILLDKAKTFGRRTFRLKY